MSCVSITGAAPWTSPLLSHHCGTRHQLGRKRRLLPRSGNSNAWPNAWTRLPILNPVDVVVSFPTLRFARKPQRRKLSVA